MKELETESRWSGPVRHSIPKHPRREDEDRELDDYCELLNEQERLKREANGDKPARCDFAAKGA